MLATRPSVKRYTITPIGEAEARSRIEMQETITVWLVGLLGSVFVFIFVWLLVKNDKMDKDTLKDVLNIVMGPLVTLLSTVVGFYFGAQSAKGSGGGDS